MFFNKEKVPETAYNIICDVSSQGVLATIYKVNQSGMESIWSEMYGPGIPRAMHLAEQKLYDIANPRVVRQSKIFDRNGKPIGEER